VGGFIIQILGRIPLADETIAFGDLEIIVTNADQRKINEVLIKPNPQPDQKISNSDES